MSRCLVRTRAAAAALLLASCARPLEVSVASPEPVRGQARRAQAEAGCVVAGRGGADPRPIPLYLDRETGHGELVVALPARVAMRWHLEEDEPRVRVRLGGDGHVRGTFFADLAGPRFRLRERVKAREPLWIEAGAAVEARADARGVVAHRASGAVAPDRVEAVVDCKDLAYDPALALPPPAAPRGARDAALADVELPLSAAPGGPLVLALVAPTHALHVVDERDGFLRVLGLGEGVGFLAWAPASALRVEERPRAPSVERVAAPAPEPPAEPEALVTVARDTPLYVGSSPAQLGAAVVEAGAVLRVLGARSDLVRVAFADGALSSWQSLWVLRHDLA